MGSDTILFWLTQASRRNNSFIIEKEVQIKTNQ